MDAQFQPLDPAKFRDPFVTAKGEARAQVALRALETLWFNTGTLCNLTCRNCYIESSPRNDRLAYLTRGGGRRLSGRDRARRTADAADRLHRRRAVHEPATSSAMLDDVLSRGFEALVLTNAMKPMRKLRPQLLALRERYGERLRIRVSLDHYEPAVHEAERGRRSWAPTIDGLVWLARNGFAIDVAGRRFSGEPEADLRAGFARLFAELDLPVDADDPVRLMLFPEMDAQRDVPEITTACWGILHKSPDDVMCASRAHGGEAQGRGDARGAGLHAAGLRSAVRARPHAGGGGAARCRSTIRICASFCVLGGAACSR